ncbi:MAG: UPF0158 family protein [Chlamydiales bacterium]
MRRSYNLLNAIRGRGAFGRFHTTIHCYKIEDDWYQFLHESLKERAIEFCNDHDFEKNLAMQHSRSPWCNLTEQQKLDGEERLRALVRKQIAEQGHEDGLYHSEMEEVCVIAYLK